MSDRCTKFAKEHAHMKRIKRIAVLLTPILLFAVLVIPYRFVNQYVIVDWLVTSNFNANDFTAWFWLFVSACVTVISGFLSKRISKEKIWLRALYIVGMLAASLLITYQFCQMMMWN